MNNNFVKSVSQKSDYDKHVKCEPINDIKIPKLYEDVVPVLFGLQMFEFYLL